MIIYGDPQLRATPASTLARLRNALQDADPCSIDDLRTVLILAGQLEQGLADLPGLPNAGPILRSVEQITDAAAAAFHDVFVAGGKPDAVARVEQVQRSLAIAMNEVRPVADEQLTIKVPEGFAFYALFPEQYCVAAQRWAGRHADAPKKSALVIGLRSIGTSLAAVVSHTLRACGWPTTRITVRPGGHPHDRRATIMPPLVGRAEFALIVDEGPGLSGSSMAAVARALLELGVGAKRISFFPGHNNEPGAAASAEVRLLWKAVPRCVASLDELRWHGKSLPDELAAHTEESFRAPVTRIDEVSAGLWRQFAYRTEAEWPAVTAAFERMKYLCRLADGRRVLWKFQGLETRRPHAGYVAPGKTGTNGAAIRRGQGRAYCHGFEASPWIEGPRLLPHNSDAATLHRIAAHLSDSAGPPLTTAESAAAFERLAHLLVWNTKETLGEAAAESACRLAGVARGGVVAEPLPSSSGGRIAPCEFIRSHEGIFKVDWAGHDNDHTIAGSQPVLWDAAAFAAEWRLDETSIAAMLQHVAPGAGHTLFTFYHAAYLAFRIGQHAICRGHNPAEDGRLQRAMECEERQLAALLEPRARIGSIVFNAPVPNACLAVEKRR